MRLIKLLIIVVTIHLGLGFTQLTVSYFAGDVADYGAAGWVSHTPIGTFINLEDPAAPQDTPLNPSNFQIVLTLANNLGDMINGLASFGYGFLAEIGPDAGIVYMVVIMFRIASVIIWLAGGMSLVYFLFDSNLLTSKIGLAIVGLGLSVTAVAGIGLFT